MQGVRPLQAAMRDVARAVVPLLLQVGIAAQAAPGYRALPVAVAAVQVIVPAVAVAAVQVIVPAAAQAIVRVVAAGAEVQAAAAVAARADDIVRYTI